MGLDEVGRGCLAGPVVTGAFLLQGNSKIKKTEKNGIPAWHIDSVLIRDSKLLSSYQRQKASEWLLAHADAWAVGISSVCVINKKGIVSATNSAFRQAVSQAQKMARVPIDSLLIDAFYIPGVKDFPQEKQKAVVKGDRLHFEIAAASIIAKVYRDSLMKKLGLEDEYAPYNWSQNKGYGTKEHRLAIQKFGTTKHHRTLFVRNCIGENKKT